MWNGTDAAVSQPQRVGYVVKRYPRYSETFILTEILAHEAAGLELEIFSLRPPNDTHFQDALALVRAPVTYVPSTSVKIDEFWPALAQADAVRPEFWAALRSMLHEAPHDVYQAVLVAARVRTAGITHLHAHFATSAADIARLAARLAGVPYTFTAHAKDIFHDSVGRDDLRRKMLDAAAIVTISEYNVHHLRSIAPEVASRIHCVRNGLDLGRFPFSSPGSRPPVVVAVGRLVEKKGFEFLIDACALLAASDVSFRCVIAGEGPLEPALRARINDLGLGARVELCGPRPQREVSALVGGAAVFAAPCVVGADGDRDGLPTVLLEAMALGTPCVSTDVTAIPEVIVDQESGILVPQRDPAALAGALERLLRDPEMRVRLAYAARQQIEERFDAQRNASRLLEIFASSAVHSPWLMDDPENPSVPLRTTNYRQRTTTDVPEVV